MTPFALEDGYITEKELAHFRHLRLVVERLPDKIISGELSCHHVCHALAQEYGNTVVDGYFGHICNHSWLVLRTNKRGEQVIADMYPVAGASSFLVFTHTLTAWHGLYKPSTDVLMHVKARDREFSENVRLVRRAISAMNT